MDHIVCQKGKKLKIQYLIRWKGYSAEHDTWEPETNLVNAKEALKEYKRMNQI